MASSSSTDTNSPTSMYRRNSTVGDTSELSGRESADLLEQAEQIRLAQLFENLAAREAIDIQCLYDNLLSCGRHTHKRAFVGAAHGIAGHDIVSFRNRFFQRPLDVRKTRA